MTRKDDARMAEEGERVERYERKLAWLSKRARRKKAQDALKRRLDKENPKR